MENGESASSRQTANSTAPNAHVITSGPLRPTLFFLAIPVLSEQLFNTFIGLFDTFLAGNLRTGNTVAAVSAVGLAAYVGWLGFMIFMLVGTGTTALVARFEGSGDRRRSNEIANQSITLAVGLGVTLCVFFFGIAPLLARFCRMTGDGFDITVHYLRIDAIGHIFTSMTLVGSAALRGTGNMRTPMLIYGAVNIVNVVASCSYVYGVGPFPEMGVSGIVCGTLTARITGAVLMIAVLIRGSSGITLRVGQLRIRWSRAWRILRIGIPAAADGAIMWTGHFAFLAIVSRSGEAPWGPAYFAAHIIAMRMEAFTYLPATAWSAAVATMIGQSLGAGDAARARRAGHEAALQCGLLSVLVATCFFFGASLIYEVFSQNELVRRVGAPPFRILALMQPVLAASIVYIGGMRGAGDTRSPLLITVVGILIRLPVGAFFGIYLQGGLIGAWIGMFADMIWRGFAAAGWFLSGRWLKTRL